MRKTEREVKNYDEVIGILDACSTIRLGLYDKPYPYVVPLSFGWERKDNNIFIYFHCAKEGKKVDLIAQNNAVCVEADVLHGYVTTERGSTTADYESVIGFGRAEQVFGDEVIHGLDLLLSHCEVKGYSARDCALSDRVAVYKISLDAITGKRRFTRT